MTALQPATRSYLLLFSLCLLFHMAGTWIIPLIDRDEPRFAEASREMMERHDYIVPFFNNAYRFDKPPLTYWAQTVSYRVFGTNDLAARFPSCVAAALTALVLLAWGRRVGGDRVGWWSAIIFSLAWQTVEHAKAAVADMWLVLFVTLAHWAGYELLRDKLQGEGERSSFNAQRSAPLVSDASPDNTPHWWWIFYFSLALAFYAKGPIGWTPLLTVALTSIFVREARVARRFRFLRGMILVLALVCLWGVPALRQTQGEFLRVGIGHHVLGRSFSSIGGHGAKSAWSYVLLLPFYFVTLFFTFFPWSIKLPWLCQRLRRERDHIDIYLLCGIAVVFGIFTLVTTRLLHYTLPVFPLLALLLARALARDESSRFFRRCARIAVPAYLFVALFISPFVGRFFPAPELFRQARDYLRPDMEFGAAEFTEPSLVWYFRARVSPFMTLLGQRNVESFMSKEGPRFAILPTDLAGKIFPTPPVNWKSFSTKGFNVVKWRRSDLTLILKPE